MKEIIKNINLTSKKLQEELAKLEMPAAPKDPRISHAVREVLANSGTSKTIDNFVAYRRRVKEWRKMKAYNLGSANAGPTTDIFRMLGLSNSRFFVQDYLPELPVQGRFVQVQQQATDNGALSPLTSENVNKTARTFTHASIGALLNKVALTVVYSDEAITFLGERLADFLELQIGLGIEESMSNQIANILLSNSVIFNTVPYASSVQQANFVDLINLMILQEEELNVYEDLRTKIPVDLVVLSQPAWQRLAVLKNTQGVRLYNSYDEAIIANDMLGTPEIPVISNTVLSDTAIVVRTREWPVALIDEIKIYNERIVETANDANRFRFTMELYFTVPYTRRVGTTPQTTGYARRATITTAVSAINQP